MVIKEIPLTPGGNNREYQGLAFDTDARFVDAECVLLERHYHVEEEYGGDKCRYFSEYKLYFPEMRVWRLYRIKEPDHSKASDLLDRVHYGSKFRFVGIFNSIDEKSIKIWENKGYKLPDRNIGLMKRLELIEPANT